MILTDRLTRRFGPAVAVDALSLEIPGGEIFGLPGPNAAGKTTALRMLAGLIGVSSGHAHISGLDVTDPAKAREVRRLVGVLPEEAGLYGDLSAARTLDFFGRLYQMSRSARTDRAEMLLTRLGLWERRDDAASSLSKGLKQRLALARALVHDPQVVLLDEPTANLDPEAAAVVRDVLLDLKAQGRTVVVNTHRLEEADECATGWGSGEPTVARRHPSRTKDRDDADPKDHHRARCRPRFRRRRPTRPGR